MKALIVVDMQNDFCTGSLAVPGALEIVGGISELLQKYEEEGNATVFTYCWHPKKHCSFVENGGKWPAHCVRCTDGAKIQPGLRYFADYSFEVFKGEKANVEEYSAFDNPILERWMGMSDIDELEICGVARNICVEATHRAAIKLGLKSTVLERLCRGIL